MTTIDKDPKDVTDLATVTETPLDQSKLLTIEPEVYAATVFDPYKKELASAKREAKKVTTELIDIKTNSGLEQFKRMRSTFVKIRTTADKAKTEKKRPIDAIGKLILSAYATLAAEVKTHEEKYDAIIDAEEKRRAEEKAEKERIERARVEAIENRIAGIKNAATRLAQASSEVIAAEIQTYTTMRLEPADYEEYLEEALTAINTTIDQLGLLEQTALTREAAERKARADAEELERLRAAQKLQEEQAKEAAAAQAKAEADRVAKDAAEKADMQRQMDELRAKLAQHEAPAAAPAVEQAPIDQPIEDPVQEPTPAPAAAPAAAAPQVQQEPVMTTQEVPRRTISDMDIVKVVAEAFNVPVNRVIDRLEGMDYAALRRQWTMGG